MKKLNLLDQYFGRLHVVGQKLAPNVTACWICNCECGNTATVSTRSLLSGNTKSCGCLRKVSHAPNMIGKKFGRLLVVSRGETRNLRAYWNCVCDCGAKFTAMAKCLRRGDTKSCGCALKEWQAQAATIAMNKPDGEASAHQIFLNYQRWARLRNHCFELTEEQFLALTKGNCFYCGAEPSQIHLHTNRRKTDTGYKYNGVDRMDNTKGYTVENSVPCCGVHNFMKKKMSAPDFIAACVSVAKHCKGLL
jgi:hypothetical protein